MFSPFLRLLGIFVFVSENDFEIAVIELISVSLLSLGKGSDVDASGLNALTTIVEDEAGNQSTFKGRCPRHVKLRRARSRGTNIQSRIVQSDRITCNRSSVEIQRIGLK